MPDKNVYNPSDHVTKVILAATRASPGIRTDALASETSLCGSTISTAGRILVERGLLRRERKGRYYHYYPAGVEDVREPQQLFISSDPLLKAEIDALKAEIDELEDEIDALEDEVSELRAFKARALAAYPDLDVDPMLLEAREIAAELFPDAVERILSGEADNGPSVRAALAALRKMAEKQA